MTTHDLAIDMKHAWVTHDIAQLVGATGTTTVDALLLQVSERSVRLWVRRGRLTRLHPSVVVLPERRDDWLVRAHAAALHTGGQLSHVTALALWQILDQRSTELHVSVDATRGVRGANGVVIHRTRGLARPYDVAGLPVSGVDRALLDSWSLLHRRCAPSGSASLARAAVIGAVRTRRTTASRLTAQLTDRRPVVGATELSELLALLEAGCQSELEIWGVRQVLVIPGLPKPQQQFRVDLPTGPVYLDAALVDVKLGIELDGAAYHGGAAHRERDIARDAALAALGWQVLRFSYRRVMDDAEGCRRDLEAVYRRRLASL